MRKILLLAALLPWTANAQERVVEVTKAYVPSVAHAVKPPLKVDSGDTQTIAPEIDYTIRPLALKTPLDVQLLKPATVTYWEFDRPQPFYLRAAGVYPFGMQLDAYGSTYQAGVGYVVGYVNHESRFKKLFQDTGCLPTGHFWHVTRGGVQAGKYFGRHTLEGGIEYRRRVIDNQGVLPAPYRWLDAAKQLRDHRIAANARFGDEFADLSRLNFEVAATADLYCQHRGSLSPQSDFSGQARLGRSWGPHEVIVGVGFDGSWGGVPDGVRVMKKYRNARYTLSPSYRLRRGTLHLAASAVLTVDELITRGVRGHFLPTLDLFWTLHQGRAIPFITLESQLIHNDYQGLIQENVYYDGSQHASVPLNTIRYTAAAGVRGLVATGRLSYRAQADYSIRLNRNFWHLTGLSGSQQRFDFEQARLATFSMNGALEGKFGGGFSASASARVMSHFFRSQIASMLPAFDGAVGAAYTHRRFALSASLSIQGPRSLTADSSLLDIPLNWSLNAGIDWSLSDRTTLFLHGRNLTGGANYDYTAAIPMEGVQVMAGVEIEF